MKYQTSSAKQTIALGKKLAKQLRGGEVIALRGELGAGKTTLVKGIAAGLGIKKTITSPTFLLMRVYSLRRSVSEASSVRRRPPKTTKATQIKHQTIKTLVHIDCYRIKNAQAIVDIGFQEYAGRPDTITVVEWPEKVKKLLPRQIITITLQSRKDTHRTITIAYA